MRKSKQKTELAAPVGDVISATKPLVKPFFDKDAEVVKFIQLILPNSLKYSIRANRIFSSKCGRTLKYRVNMIDTVWQEGSFCSQNHIVASYYVQINVNLDDGKFELVNLTFVK